MAWPSCAQMSRHPSTLEPIPQSRPMRRYLSSKPSLACTHPCAVIGSCHAAMQFGQAFPCPPCKATHSGFVGTTHLLLPGVDPFIVMVQGRRSSHASLAYWRRCEEIILFICLEDNVSVRIASNSDPGEAERRKVGFELLWWSRSSTVSSALMALFVLYGLTRRSGASAHSCGN